MSVGEFCSGDRASFLLLMAVTCSPSCIVTALALCRVSVESLLTKKTEPANSSRFSAVGIGFVVFQQKLWYASSSLPPNVTYVSSVTMRSLSILPLVVVKHLILNLRPIENFCAGGNTVERTIKEFKLRTKLWKILMNGFIRRQNHRESRQ